MESSELRNKGQDIQRTEILVKFHKELDKKSLNCYWMFLTGARRALV